LHQNLPFIKNVFSDDLGRHHRLEASFWVQSVLSHFVTRLGGKRSAKTRRMIMKAKYTRIYSDADGESHFEDVEVELEENDYAPPAPPMYLTAFGTATQVVFLGAKADWHGEVWHPSPRRQFIILPPGIGRMEQKVSDGETRIQDAGEVWLFEDTWGKGHSSRFLVDEGVANGWAIVIQLPDE